MATHSSVLAWRIPGTGEPSGLPSVGSHRVRHDWSDSAATAGTLKEVFVEVLAKPLGRAWIQEADFRSEEGSSWTCLIYLPWVRRKSPTELSHGFDKEWKSMGFFLTVKVIMCVLEDKKKCKVRLTCTVMPGGVTAGSSVLRCRWACWSLARGCTRQAGLDLWSVFQMRWRCGVFFLQPHGTSRPLVSKISTASDTQH